MAKGLLGTSELVFMPCLTVNATRDHSPPDFVHMPCCMPLLSLTFPSSSQLTLCSPHDEVFTYISLSLPYTLSRISVNSFCCQRNGCTRKYSMGERVSFAEEFGASRNRGPGGDLLRAHGCSCRRGRVINRRQRPKVGGKYN
jgi:hypothetical protein